jgi:hypothetical protein
MVGLRMAPEQRRAVEKWAKTQEDKPTFSEALRRLVDIALKAERTGR